MRQISSQMRLLTISVTDEAKPHFKYEPHVNQILITACWFLSNITCYDRNDFSS